MLQESGSLLCTVRTRKYRYGFLRKGLGAEREAKGKDRIQRQQTLADKQNGRDEMNLVDLPVFLLSTRTQPGVHVRQYEIEEFDRTQHRPVRRRLTVTGDAHHGLPSSAAEEVYLGLLHHTRAWNDFSEAVMFFSRGELLKTLGWGDRNSAYQRLARSFDQLCGVRLKCENFWRDNRAREYRSVENISLIDYYRFRDSRNRRTGTYRETLSEMRWGAALFESFDAGYLKKLNLDVALGLKPLARRLYRLLDKHFHPPKRTRLVYNLRELAHERLGMSRNYDVAQIRRYLEPAIHELVEIGFLRGLPDAVRFVRKEGWRGHWDVVFPMETIPAAVRSTLGARRDVSPVSRNRSRRPECRIFRNGRHID